MRSDTEAQVQHLSCRCLVVVLLWCENTIIIVPGQGYVCFTLSRINFILVCEGGHGQLSTLAQFDLFKYSTIESLLPVIKLLIHLYV